MVKPACLWPVIALLFASVTLAQNPDVAISAQPFPALESDLVLTQVHDGGAFVLRDVGDRLAVVLEGNLTTGYSWEVEAVEESILQQVGEADFFSDSDAIGAGGRFVLRFAAVAPGQTRLRLVYHRPWEEGVEPLAVFEVDIAVQISSLRYEGWKKSYGLDLNEDGRIDEADYELWQENPVEPLPSPDDPGIPGETPVGEPFSYEDWLEIYAVDLNEDGQVDEADYELWQENPFIGIQTDDPIESSLSYEEWLAIYGDDLNEDGQVDEADYELWQENPYIGMATSVSSTSWGALKEAAGR